MSIAPDTAGTSKQPRRALRVLVTGSRDWSDQKVIYDALDTIARSAAELTVVHGDCPKGADYWAKRYCWENLSDLVNDEPHPADWKRYKNRAGYIRNAEMAKLGADLCIAFIRNDSPGATGCAREALANDIPVVTFTQTYPDLTQVADALAMVEAPCG